MGTFHLAVMLLLLFGLLQGMDLGLGQDLTVLSRPGLQSLQPQGFEVEIVPHPDGPDTAGRNLQAHLPQLVGHPDLAAVQGIQKAAYYRDTVTKQMTRDQIAEAQKLAREWRPKR